MDQNICVLWLVLPIGMLALVLFRDAGGRQGRRRVTGPRKRGAACRGRGEVAAGGGGAGCRSSDGDNVRPYRLLCI